MKKLILSALSLLCMGAVGTEAAAQFSVVKDGKVLFVLPEGTPDYVTFENVLPCGGTIGKAVDMGLSVKWSSVNVGASNPQDAGNYFAWGETASKSDYSWSTYKHIYEGGTSWQDVNKYTVNDGKKTETVWYNNNTGIFTGDNKTVLESSDDVATQSWGEEWRMPTQAEWEELYNNTTRVWTDDYNGTGVKGYILTSTKEGHTNASIFLPAAGYRNGSNLSYEGSNGYYWSSSLNAYSSDSGRSVYFYSGFLGMSGSFRCNGQLVRPVRACH